MKVMKYFAVASLALFAACNNEENPVAPESGNQPVDVVMSVALPGPGTRAAMGELQNVENIAVNNMGMHKPNEWEIIYLPQIEQPEKQSEDEGSLDQAANQVKDIIGTIMP